MANMISEPNSEPFSPMTTSTFVCKIATVTVESSTPIAVLPITPPKHTHMKRSPIEWNCLVEQKMECRLVRTAK